jgi:hypothetical protein
MIFLSYRYKEGDIFLNDQQKRRISMVKIVSLLIITVLLGFTLGCTQYHAQGAGTGAVIGGVAGALLAHHNPWRGGVIGGALGAVTGATLADISMRASQEAVDARGPVEYRTYDGRGMYRAEPLAYDGRTNCHKVQEKVWEDGQLIKDQVREVCEGEKTERRY